MFEEVPRRDADDALLAYPLAWITCEGAPFATPAPVQIDPDRPNELIGHIPRKSPLRRCFETGAVANFLIVGPNAYMSPSWLTRRDWAPTWNYVSLQFQGATRLVDDAAFLRRHLFQLCGDLERAHGSSWTPAELGARFDALAKHVVAFVASIETRQIRFKLGQDESERDFHELAAGARAAGHGQLADWMARLNAPRLNGPDQA